MTTTMTTMKKVNGTGVKPRFARNNHVFFCTLCMIFNLTPSFFFHVGKNIPTCKKEAESLGAGNLWGSYVEQNLC